MIQRAQADPAFCQQLVEELLSFKTENETLKNTVSEHEQSVAAAKLALCQAKGFSAYFKDSQDQLSAWSLQAKEAMKKALDLSNHLEEKRVKLEEKMKTVQQKEYESKLALRQARGVTTYLKTQNQILEKKLMAASGHSACSSQSLLRHSVREDEEEKHDLCNSFAFFDDDGADDFACEDDNIAVTVVNVTTTM